MTWLLVFIGIYKLLSCKVVLNKGLDEEIDTQIGIFIDDIKDNVKLAKQLGIHGIIFKDKKQTESEIEEIRRRTWNEEYW